ncbi:hypothetical protein ACGFXB_43565 [Streptomyces canus]|uniref:hypothetical protein n=1 Tax=Streptomyces canus TaxID=58343 RepID=UPI00371962FB
MNDVPQDRPPARAGAAAPGVSGETVAEVLNLAASRRLTVDDHMFHAGRTSFRLQLFTAPGQRAVAVATQAEDEAPSLTNVAESCVAAVWQQHCPDQELPPVWIERQLSGAFGREPDFRLVTFGEAEPHEVRNPRWSIHDQRGTGYAPRRA